MSLGERIGQRIKEQRTTQAALAKAIGVSPQAISKLVTGETTETSRLYQIARELETTPEYLLGETDDPGSRLSDKRLPWKGAQPDTERDSDTVQVHHIDLSFGLGAAITDTQIFEDQAETLEFPKAWLRMITPNAPSQLCWARGRGDSMYPTIGDGDVILIDRSQRNLRDSDLIWAANYGDVAIVKRLRPMPDGGVKILSDNDRVSPEVAYDGELSIFGRVIAVVRRL